MTQNCHLFMLIFYKACSRLFPKLTSSSFKGDQKLTEVLLDSGADICSPENSHICNMLKMTSVMFFAVYVIKLSRCASDVN